jgi:hypothetical protein
MNKIETALHAVGKAFENIFDEGDKVALFAEPFVDRAFPALAPLYNAGANGAAAAIAAAKGVLNPTASDSENLCAIAVAVEPILLKFASQTGLTPPSTAVVLLYAQDLQQGLKNVATPPAA